MSITLISWFGLSDHLAAVAEVAIVGLLFPVGWPTAQVPGQRAFRRETRYAPPVDASMALSYVALPLSDESDPF
jgi:hypothetical protein